MWVEQWWTTRTIGSFVSKRARKLPGSSSHVSSVSRNVTSLFPFLLFPIFIMFDRISAFCNLFFCLICRSFELLFEIFIQFSSYLFETFNLICPIYFSGKLKYALECADAVLKYWPYHMKRDGLLLHASQYVQYRLLQAVKQELDFAMEGRRWTSFTISSRQSLASWSNDVPFDVAGGS